MEANLSASIYRNNDQMDLPPGFRFHPTDEELITHYLSKKVVDSGFSSAAIAEVDMNQVEPWELPMRAKMGEKEWYFFCIRDKKYPTGQRTNRATPTGYWKATGKDKEIFRGNALVGMKKTLVFYFGRAPRGEKSNWVSHEFRLEGRLSPHNRPEVCKSDWVITRVFQKASGGEKVDISELMEVEAAEPKIGFSGTAAPMAVAPEIILEDSIDYMGNPIVPPASESFSIGAFDEVGFVPAPGWAPINDPMVYGNFGQNLNQSFETGNVGMDMPNVMMGNNLGFGNQAGPLGANDFDYIWD